MKSIKEEQIARYFNQKVNIREILTVVVGLVPETIQANKIILLLVFN